MADKQVEQMNLGVPGQRRRMVDGIAEVVEAHEPRLRAAMNIAWVPGTLYG